MRIPVEEVVKLSEEAGKAIMTIYNSGVSGMQSSSPPHTHTRAASLLPVRQDSMKGRYHLVSHTSIVIGPWAQADGQFNCQHGPRHHNRTPHSHGLQQLHEAAFTVISMLQHCTTVALCVCLCRTMVWSTRVMTHP